MSITKQRSTAGKSVAIFFIVFIILELLIIAGVSLIFKNKDSTPEFMGYNMYVMDSDKMGDHIPQGALVIGEHGAPRKEGIKKAVICKDVPGIGTSVFWLANVSSSADLTGVVYTVYQDKQPNKLYQLRTENIVATATSYYKTAGAFVRFVTSNFGRIALITGPLFLLVLIEVIILIVNRIRYSEDDEDDEDEDEPRNNVELDDFLFGGKNNKEKIANSVQTGAEVAEELKAGERGTRIKKAAAAKGAPDVKFDKPDKQRSAGKNTERSKEVDADDFFGKPEKKAPKNDKPASEKKDAPKTDKKPEGNANDPYYEKASKLIDGVADDAAEETKADNSSDISFNKKPKDISASLEDLMKLMEAESNKLKDQLGENKNKDNADK